MSNVPRQTLAIAIRYSLFAILFCTLALAEPTVWPVPFEAKAMFPATLELARESACKDIAALIDREDYAAALALTEKTIAGPFLWRGALTNGYQQGFCLYALQGLLLEQQGEVVRAYRAYQNSRACFDDNTVMVAQPEPRLEVYAGTGRMCVEAGRYTDALAWLETVRIEGNDVPYLCALADRGLIRRAVEIGDYHDAITNYWDLQAQLAAQKRGDGGCTMQDVRSALQHVGSDMHDSGNDILTTNDLNLHPESSILHPVSCILYPSPPPLSRAEYRELAQLYFWTWRDREGFAQVLDGITLLGIDNDLGVRDPMVDCFLNNIMRADDHEIQRFYDLLGYAITQARALPNDEEYVVFLVTTRSLMSTLYNYLRQADDMQSVSQTVSRAQQSMGSAILASGRRGNLLCTVPRQIATLGRGTSRVPRYDWSKWEDDLMAADIMMRHGRYRDCLQRLNRILADSCMTNKQAQAYDGTLFQHAVWYGICVSARLLNTNIALTVAWPHDGSYRSRVCKLMTVSSCDEAGEFRHLPLAHPLILKTLVQCAGVFMQATNHVAVLLAVENYRRRTTSVPAYLARAGCAVYLETGEWQKAFELALHAWRYAAANDEIDALDALCGELWKAGDDQHVKAYTDAVRGVVVRALHCRLGTCRLTSAKCRRAVAVRDDIMAERARCAAQSNLETRERVIDAAPLTITDLARRARACFVYKQELNALSYCRAVVTRAVEVGLSINVEQLLMTLTENTEYRRRCAEYCATLCKRGRPVPAGAPVTLQGNLHDSRDSTGYAIQ